jgi:glycosyltransferase involved in cell wall biosynthesis
VIGGGPLEGEVLRQAADPECPVKCVGFVNQGALPVYMQAIDVLVVPSKSDAHPLVVTEALALSKPVIISDKCGNWGYSDVVRPGINGYVFRWNDKTSLIHNILLLVDEERRRRMAEAGAEISRSQDVSEAARMVEMGIDRIVEEGF